MDLVLRSPAQPETILPRSNKQYLAARSVSGLDYQRKLLLGPAVWNRGGRGERSRVAVTRATMGGTGARLVGDSEMESEAPREMKERRGLRGKTEADIVVIGSGLGGLCAAALLSRYGNHDVLVLESHYLPGGAAHGFARGGYRFDTGPSLFSGLSSRGPQANPLAQVLDAIDERVECVPYDSWRCYLPEGDFLSRIGPTHFYEVLHKYVGDRAVEDWRKLLAAVKPLAGPAMALPPTALRADPAVVLTAGLRYGTKLLPLLAEGGLEGALRSTQLLGPFSELVAAADVSDPFVLNWVNLLSFLLSGQKADATIAAEIVYMFAEWFQPGCQLEYPKGGAEAIVAALLRGVEKHGGQISLNCHVDSIAVENGRATGVKLRSGQFIRAKTAVVSNASIWDTMKLLPGGSLPFEYRQQASSTPECDSFMHLHLGIPADNLPSSLPDIHHIVVNDWLAGVDAPQNVVLLSLPSVLDPSLAPAGAACLHAYTPGTEPASLWEGLTPGSPPYEQLKQERAEVLWKAVERVLGPTFDRSKCDVALVGTPLTHGRFLRRHRGTYGPAIPAGKGNFPGPMHVPVPGLYCCGDSTFPGIGVPAVAASGAMVANTLTPVWDHWKLLDTIGV